MNHAPQILLSLPARSAAGFAQREQHSEPDWVAVSDPIGSKLGSGGGTAHLLTSSWRRTSTDSFATWLHDSPKLIVHAGGESRRAPAYAAAGKILIPMPVWRWSLGQHVDQTLLDLQLPFLDAMLARAHSNSRVLLSSGDVLLRSATLPAGLPEADVVCLGLWVSPEQARHFGVFFCPRRNPEHLDFMIQKPTPERIQAFAEDHVFMIDTGLWLLSERAVDLLLARSGWDVDSADFRGGNPSFYDLYTTFGQALGSVPTCPDPDISALSVAVVPLPQGEFYHFGTSRDLIDSSLRLQNVVLDQRRFGNSGTKPHPAMFTQNAVIGCPLRPENHTLWIENACVPETWTLTSEHVITGVPQNTWQLSLPPGACLDIIPIDNERMCLRPYGIDDPFRGAVGSATTLWQGRPAPHWFRERGLDLHACGIDPAADIQQAPLFPVLSADSIDSGFVQWLLDATTAPAAAPSPSLDRAGGAPLNQPVAGASAAAADSETGAAGTDWAACYAQTPRLSASEIAAAANLDRLEAQRRRLRADAWPRLARHAARSVFFRLDLKHAAAEWAEHNIPLPPAGVETDVLRQVRDHMFRAEVCRLRQEATWEQHAAQAFQVLRTAMIERIQEQGATPSLQLLEDQIMWGRSPVRLDLAGGWTDTPPYCLQHGGRVVNLGVELNGQAPIQVFVRAIESPEIVLRSIDLGAEEHIRSFADLATYDRVGGIFSIPRAALALAGFLPAFGHAPETDLPALLARFGGGLELSLLAAVPKGSGLGTSSILAATVLGTLNNACGLGWSSDALIERTLVLEQMLTTGGGWQDQAGGILPSVKCVETSEGLSQKPVVHWLPERLFRDHANGSMLLYYTGITRVAKGILQEIVRGMFLNSREHLQILTDLGDHARHTATVIQRNDWDGLTRAIQRSWQLNCRLDSGTNPPPVNDLLQRIADHTAGAKLLGAGGGGYLLILAKDVDAAARIRRSLAEQPPNAKARMVDFSLSANGFQVTHS